MGLVDIRKGPVRALLKELLQDKTTKRNILFATDTWAEYGDDYDPKAEMTKEKILCAKSPVLIQSRSEKNAEEQRLRTRQKAEVFTPAWIVNRMNNCLDAEILGRGDVFNSETECGWSVNQERIVFLEGDNWQQYVEQRVIEITCGEAPFIVSRYDSVTGERLEIEHRIGVLDRKLRVVNENTVNDEEWLKWAVRAFQSVYGYEFQGDNLLIARANLLLTFTEAYEARFGVMPKKCLLQRITDIICWNFWQMDGLTGRIPFAEPEVKPDLQPSLFDAISSNMGNSNVDCVLMNWDQNCEILYKDIKRSWRNMGRSLICVGIIWSFFSRVTDVTNVGIF